MNSDYGDRPLYAGAVLRGQRVWYVDQSATLYGMTFPKPWAPGENVAECYNESYIDGYNGGSCPCQLCMSMRVRDAGPKVPKWRETAHDVSIKCACGWYGITGHSNEYLFTSDYTRHRLPRIEGIIEGYGKVVVGSKGFRAQKAQIVALVVPEGRRTNAASRSWHDLTDMEKKERVDRCEGRTKYLPMRYIDPRNPFPMPSGVPLPHLTFDIEHHAPDGVYKAGERLAKADTRGCICLRGLAEEAIQLRRAGSYGTGTYWMDYDPIEYGRVAPINAELLGNRYGVPIFPTMADAQQEFPLMGGDQFPESPSDNASPIEEVDEALKAIGTATYVDADSPDLGEV